jgi:hypothetical protein
VLPEYFCMMGARDTDKLGLRETAGAGTVQGFLADAAREFGLWIVGGTLPIESTDAEHVRNSSLAFSPEGECVARYDKIHLFFFDNGTERYDERRVIEPGHEPVVFELPSRDGHSWRVGMSVCYDLRFPELYRALAKPPTCCWCPAPSPHHRRRALGGAAARPRHREPGLRGRARAGRHARKRPPHLGPVAGGRPLGRGGGAAGQRRGRGAVRHRRRAGRAHARAAARAGPLRAVAMSDALLTVARSGGRCWRSRGCARCGSAGSLWLLLAVLVSALLVTVVWLAGRYEVEQVQAALDRDTADAVSDIRSGFSRATRRACSATQAPGADRAQWPDIAASLLREHREWLRLEWRDAALRPLPAEHALPHAHVRRGHGRRAVRRRSWPAPPRASWARRPIRRSHFVPQADGGGSR